MTNSLQDPPTQESPLRRIRQEQGLTREALAFRAHVSVRTVDNAERCAVRPTPSTQHLLATALGLEPQELFPRERSGS